MKLALCFLLCVALVPETSGDPKCWFCKKTRSGEACNGKIRRISEGIARYARINTNAWACDRHWTRARRDSESFCACPRPRSDHSRAIHPLRIPRRFYSLFDRVGENLETYIPGTRWCTSCARNADREFQHEPDYVPPTKRSNPRTCTENTITKETCALSEITMENQNLQMELNKAKEEIEHLSGIATFEELVPSFQLALYRHQESEGKPLYEPHDMQMFADKHAPGLWKSLESAITRNAQMGCEKKELQQQRVVSLLHTIAYFRSQKTSGFQKDSGLHASLSGMSLCGLTAGQVIGFSANPRTIELHKQNLAENQQEFASTQIATASEMQYFMLMLLDDYHNIHTKKVPNKLQTSVAVHMASSMVDIHKDIPAVSRPNQPLHRQVPVTVNGRIRICHGGICSMAVKKIMEVTLQKMQSTYLGQMTPNAIRIDPAHISQSFKELRVYEGTSHDELATLESCTLLDVFEKPLKSKLNYKEAIDYVFSQYPGLKLYATQNIVPLPADWPGFYFPKKLIAQGKENEVLVLPEQGQFHVFLNAVEDTIKIFKFFFDKLYSTVFGGQLAQKPKPFRSSLCLTAAFLGWNLVRDKILSKFGNCKAHEFQSVFYLLDHIVPIVFLQYELFRTGDIHVYENLMAQLAVIFICWNRKHYNKATLSFLSDLEYQKKFIPEYFAIKLRWMAVITEKKIEILHSLLRRFTRSHNNGEEIQKTARSLGGTGLLNYFKQLFVPDYRRGKGEPNYWLIAGKTAEFLLEIFKTIASKGLESHEVPREKHRNGKPKGKKMFEFPSFGSKVDIRAMPLGYHHEKFEVGLDPNPEYLCDNKFCRNNDTSVRRLACGHMFHLTCIASSNMCIICQKPLKQTVQDLSDKFNEGLLQDLNNCNSDSNSSDSDSDSEENVNFLTQDSAKYYTSPVWQRKVDNIVSSYNIEEPQKTNMLQGLLRPQQRPQPATPAPSVETCKPPPSVPHVYIQPTNHASFSTWHFPQTLSQSTILGRTSGSNACTLIALTIAKLFILSPTVLHPGQPLNQSLLHQIIVGIIRGNAEYDKATKGVPRMFSVKEACGLLSYLGSIVIGSELPVSVQEENTATASLPFHLESAAAEGRTISLFILCGNTVLFLPTTAGMILIDSHIHGSTGAYVALCPKGENLFRMLAWFRDFNSFPFNLGSVTKVKFN